MVAAMSSADSSTGVQVAVYAYEHGIVRPGRAS
jgi:hypothetical protein